MEYGCIYFKKSDFDREIPSIPIFVVKRFNFNKRPISETITPLTTEYFEIYIQSKRTTYFN